MSICLKACCRYTCYYRPCAVGVKATQGLPEALMAAGLPGMLSMTRQSSCQKRMSKLSRLAKITSLHVRVPEESTGGYQLKVRFQLPSDYTIKLNVDFFLGSSLMFLSAYLDALIALLSYSSTNMA